MCAVFVHSLEFGKSMQVTDALSDARFANFDFFLCSPDVPSW